MHFKGFQCTQKGRLRLSGESRGGTIHVDDFGGIWATSEDAQEVLYYAPHTLAAAMDQQRQVSLPPSTPGDPVESLSSSSPAHTVAFRCHTPTSEKGDASQDDRISAVFSFNRDVCDATGPRRDVCIVTQCGVLVFIRVPFGDGEEPSLLGSALQPYQEVCLGMRVCAATVTSGTAQHLVLCCYDGFFTEVIRAAVVAVNANSAEPLDSAVSATGDGECEVDATGLFRVEGRIATILHDPGLDVLVTISDTGYVDVWDAVSAQDATAIYGSLSWDCNRYGAPTCALLCRNYLWVGLTTGQLLVFPFSSCRGATSIPLSYSPQALRSHTSRITTLLSVSLGTVVWSCAADSPKVNVWDAASAVLSGSFVFPNSGLASWQVGATQVRTALWGIEGTTGELSFIQVTRSLSDSNGIQARNPEETSAQRRGEALLHAYQTVWRSVAQQLRHVLLGDAEDAHVDAGEATSSALQLMGNDASGVGDISDVVGAIHQMRKAARQLRAAHHRGDHRGEEKPTGLPSLIEAAVACHEQQGRVSHEVEALLRSLNAFSSKATCFTSLEEVAEEMILLRARVEELQLELTRMGDCRDDDTVIKTGEETANEIIAKELQGTQHTLSFALNENAELRAQLSEAQSEVTSLTSQLAQTQQLLEASGEEVGQLRRSLLAAKRAAEVTASDVSSIFEMESRLHESQGVIAELSAKVDSLVNEAGATSVLLQAFQEKQVAAKEVLQRVLRSQNDLADDVGAFVDTVGAAIVAFKKRHNDTLSEPAAAAAAALTVVVEEEMNRLEESIENRLNDQQMWFHSLSQELKVTLA
ncbi:hypothetical protein JKF63_05887 [Porcisia hertigi]|uniref:Uncharacterized protein n=1 Tax=Porcisia hertigi TaxID=2761500 RepID=A0A836I702_9TRYP|nr:hypothetical protein JKF63_05887 [Porcisia hertigi]